MKVLFMGVGLTDYYNQVLNKMNRVPDLEISNLVDAGGRGHVGSGVHQTTKGVEFKVFYLKEKTIRRFSEYSYKGFVGFDALLQETKPDIIVSSETYIKWLYTDKTVRETIEKLKIKVIMKDIPFRLEKYETSREKITSGYAHTTFMPFFAIYFKKICEKIRLQKLGNSVGKILSFLKIPDMYNSLFGKRILLKKLEDKKAILNYPDAHVDYVEEAFDIFGSYGVSREKIFIIYNSPDTDLLLALRKEIENEAPILPPCKHRIMHIGRLIEWKRIDMLIRSFKDVNRTFHDSELLIVGTGPQENYLKKLTKELKLEKNVRFVGGVYDPRDIGKYFLSSTIYVLAGMGGISINDAMIFGKPVICSVCDGTEKKLVYNGRNGLYFKDGDQSDLTTKIQKLLSDKNLIKTMGLNSTLIIEKEINIHTVIRGYIDAFTYVRNNNS